MNHFEYTSKTGRVTWEDTVVFSSVKTIVIIDDKIKIYLKGSLHFIEMTGTKELQKKLCDDFKTYLQKNGIPHHACQYAYLTAVIVVDGLALTSVSNERLVLNYQDRDLPVYIDTTTSGILAEINKRVLAFL
jgi:hypothetical protein